MSYARIAALKLTLWRAVLIATLPTACAVGVTQEDTGDMSDPVNTAGSSSGGTLGTSGGTSVLPKAGTTSSAGSAVVSPFGGSASSGGNAGSGSGGSSAAGSSAAGHTSGGASGSSAGGSASGSGGSGGSGTGTCACPKKVTWTDNTVLSWAKGDCVDVAGKIYLYTGTIAQTYANGQCNPTKQEAWCTDSGNDYKFMLCM